MKITWHFDILTFWHTTAVNYSTPKPFKHCISKNNVHLFTASLHSHYYSYS